MFVIVTISAVIGFAGLCYFFVPWFYGRISRALLAHRVRKLGALVLTFDDGPGSRLTRPILDLLAEHNAKATFFVTGRKLAGREYILREAADRGHEIGLHGYHHLNHWKVSPWRAINDIVQIKKATDAVLGRKDGVYAFRPPFGNLNLLSMIYLLAKRIPVIYWTRDFGDTRRFDAWLAANKDGKSNEPEPILPIETSGDVILAHDFDRTETAVDGYLLACVKATLDLAKKNNLRILTVSQLLNVKD
ncbi:MAG: polysaccharide deacetylase family protein [Sedimentisphaerales bacterium]|nr:polysaccharide deacetylase family protein [Sedimentisphaerales bacterium]